MKLFAKAVPVLFLFLFSAVILALSLRGLPGNPTKDDLQSNFWKEEGPFELSPERGRFALLYSFVEDNSFIFDIPIARFATPDVAIRSDGKYVSLFAPGVSFIVMPGYLIGKYFAASQVGAFAVISIIAIINLFFIRAIALRLGASQAASTIGALLFLFASPAFAYAVSLYQHHISVFLILFSIYSLLRFRSFIALCIVWLLFATSIVVDYPNAIFMVPIALFALLKIINITQEEGKRFLLFRPLYLVTFLAIIPSLFFYTWFSQLSYNKPLQFAGTLRSIQTIDEEGKPVESEKEKKSDSDKDTEPKKKKSVVGFFKTRNLIDGFYIHVLSDERGIVWYAPVLLLGIIGGVFLYKKNGQITSLFVGIIGGNVLLYSMWGDPWGGWAFGSRYLIPTYALLAILLAVGLTYVTGVKRLLMILTCIVLASYSIMVNTLGAITTSRVPPKVEAVALSEVSNRVEKYSYDRNIEYLQTGNTKAFVWRAYASSYVDAQTYYWIIIGIIGIGVLPFFFYMLFFERRKT